MAALKDIVRETLRDQDLHNNVLDSTVYGSRTAKLQVLSSESLPLIRRALIARNLRVRVAGNSLEVDSPGKDEVLAEERVRSKIKEWRKILQAENPTGFRKARTATDPRKFAMELARLTGVSAKKYNSPSLQSLSKQLRKVANSPNVLAAKAILQSIADEGNDFLSERPIIKKPESETVESSRSAGANLLVRTRSWIEDYISTNSINKNDLATVFSDPNVIDGWRNDMDSQGLDPDSDEGTKAWEQVKETFLGDDAEAQEVEQPGFTGPDGPQARMSSGKFQFTAPGGDWVNTTMAPDESMDHATKRKATPDRIVEATEQLMETFSGSMHPSEISEEEAKQFLQDQYPDVPWKKVYDGMLKLVEGPTRHEEKESSVTPDTDIDAKWREPRHNRDEQGQFAPSHGKKKRKKKKKKSSVMDALDQATRSSGVMVRVACGSCGGSGTSKCGGCSTCGGSGQKKTAGQKSENVIHVDLTTASASDRKALRQLVDSTDTNPILAMPFRKNLIAQLQERNIGYRTASYISPAFRMGRTASDVSGLFAKFKQALTQYWGGEPGGMTLTGELVNKLGFDVPTLTRAKILQAAPGGNYQLNADLASTGGRQPQMQTPPQKAPYKGPPPPPAVPNRRGPQSSKFKFAAKTAKNTDPVTSSNDRISRLARDLL
jgi:hypothetical protein